MRHLTDISHEGNPSPAPPRPRPRFHVVLASVAHGPPEHNSTRRRRRIALAIFAVAHFCCIVPFGSFAAAPLDPAKLPPPAKVQIEFERDIKPLLETTCLRCHGTERPKSGFRLDN